MYFFFTFENRNVSCQTAGACGRGRRGYIQVICALFLMGHLQHRLRHATSFAFPNVLFEMSIYITIIIIIIILSYCKVVPPSATTRTRICDDDDDITCRDKDLWIRIVIHLYRRIYYNTYRILLWITRPQTGI